MVQPCSTHLFKRGHGETAQRPEAALPNTPALACCTTPRLKFRRPQPENHGFFSDHGMFQPSYMGMILR